ncbi:hypothetical protein G4B84_001088 [Aspergillus flavus NRRL3357]|nr:uncharacterized protein G4B84_001088 [Aspergillus flavus NRRL3357]QMW25843.1 hypothetical protein G4B84_001088 [Aspergillus flavus NRRL3357]QMW37926.1 hypothetical protein G4B11_001162 [Aspergillus flavus]
MVLVRHVHDVRRAEKLAFIACEAPTLSYTKQLEARVAQLEDALSKLRSQQQSAAEVRKASTPSSTGEGRGSMSPSLRTRIKEEDESSSADLAREFEGLKVEHDGRISFHGPTSLFQLPSGALNEAASTSRLAVQHEARKERLINNAWRERAFEQMATMPEPFQYLLDSHWCWIQPLFNFVYRPAFTRDMKINGPYYSDALLNAILSHSVRWCKSEPRIGHILDSFDGGAQFSHRAVSGLYDSLKVGHLGIPTIQTLLLLSAQECGRGNRSQAWLYSGMAFRMLEDLGISIDSRKYSDSAHLSDEDIEIRNRLFWSCYFWDKMVSLYFGRSPTMQHSRVSPPRTVLDDTSEIEIWTPHGVVFPDGAHYPPTQAHSTSCFMKMCGLAEVLNQILIHIYDPIRQVSEAEFYNCVIEQARNLAEWWDELPDYLKLVPTSLPPYSPPSHIVILNVYTAASIFLLEIQALKYAAPGTLDKLKFCIFALERVKVSNPVISTALSLVYQELQKLQIDIHIVLPTLQPEQPQPRSQPPSRHSHSPSQPQGLSLQQQQQQQQQQQHQQFHTPSTFSDTSRHVSPSHQPSPDASSIAASVAPSGVNTSFLPGYSFQQPVADFELSQTGVPQMAGAHLLGGMPNALMTLDNPGSYEITPEVFEAFSYAEPITTNMTPAFEPRLG